MKFTVLVAPTPNGRAFRAKSGKPHQLAVEAPDREAAYSALAELLRSRVSGIELHRIDSEKYHPLFETFGTIDPNAASTKEWEQAVQDYRVERDAEDDTIVSVSGDAA